MKKKHSNITTTRIIIAGFLLTILIGTVLLSLPCAQKTHLALSDVFFVATSSVCVTGLSTINIGTSFTFFGQIVLWFLIEIGGLGVITITTSMMLFFGKRISLNNRLLIQKAYNTDSLTGLVRMTKRIVRVSMVIQAIGAILYCIVFIRDYGPIGIWYGIFHSTSAYCNAGIDLLGGNSFVQYQGNILINLTTMCLIIAGGLGFPLYWEIGARILKPQGKHTKKFSMGAKIVFSATAILILVGAGLTMLFEWNNPQTLGTLSTGNKILASFFQSVTLRTAGFATTDQAGFSSASCLVYLVLMLIGGSPAGTAGGIKTVTFVVIAATMVTNIKGNKHVNLFHRKVEDEYVKNCTAIASFSIATLLILTAWLMFVQDGNFLDTLYEMTSAVGTVGLTRGLTTQLCTLGKLIVCLTMYLGRIGPISIALSFNYKTLSEIEYAGDRLTIG